MLTAVDFTEVPEMLFWLFGTRAGRITASAALAALLGGLTYAYVDHAKSTAAAFTDHIADRYETAGRPADWAGFTATLRARRIPVDTLGGSATVTFLGEGTDTLTVVLSQSRLVCRRSLTAGAHPSPTTCRIR